MLTMNIFNIFSDGMYFNLAVTFDKSSFLNKLELFTEKGNNKLPMNILGHVHDVSAAKEFIKGHANLST